MLKASHIETFVLYMEHVADSDSNTLHHFLFDASLKLTGAGEGARLPETSSAESHINEAGTNASNKTNALVEINLDSSDEERNLEDGDAQFFEVKLDDSTSSDNELKILSVNKLDNQVLYNNLYVPEYGDAASASASIRKSKGRGRVRLKKTAGKKRKDWENSSTSSGASNCDDEEKKFKCPWCPRKFRFSRNLTSHKKWKHPLNGGCVFEQDQKISYKSKPEKNSCSIPSQSNTDSDYEATTISDNLMVGHSIGVEGETLSTSGSVKSSSSIILAPYPGDDQIMERYLYDSSLVSGTGNNIPSSKPCLYEEKEEVGILPEKIGVRYEDCEFNSSDSFASTESIIEKKFLCTLCPKRFMFKGDLVKHTKYKHPTSKYRCQLCKKLFNYQGTLKSHLRRYHDKKLVVAKMY